MRAGHPWQILPMVFALALLACGGGGGSGGGSGNRAPTAVAGPGVAGFVGELLTFNGSGSSDPDGNPIAYVWSIASAPAGSAASLIDAATPAPKLRPDTSGTYVLSLVVSDGSLVSAPSTTTATVTLDPANQSQQNASRITATTSAATQTTQLNWSDGFPNGSVYRIERLENGVFIPIETIVGLGGTGALMQWTRPYTGPVTYRVMALTGGREIPLLTPTGAASIAVSLGASMDIQLSKAEPLSGTVQVSVVNLPSGATVTWFQNLSLVGTGNPLNWATSSVPNGSRLLQAIVDLGGGAFVDLRRTVSILNTPLAASFTQSLTLNQLEVVVDASSSAGITSVTAMTSDPSSGGTQTLNAPNHCVGCTPGVPNRYRFVFTIALASGNITVNVLDGAGATLQLQGTFSLAPVTLSLATPHAEAYLFGTLNVSGTSSSQAGNTVTTTAALGDVTFLTTTQTNFSGSFSLSGVPPGLYTLTVTAKGANGAQASIQRPVFVVSSAAFAHQPLFTVDAINPAEDLLSLALRDADDNTVLYRPTFPSSAPSYTYRVTPNSHAAMATTSGGEPSVLWQNSVFGNVNGVGISPADASCTSAGRCIYNWSAVTGTITNLSGAVGAPAPSSSGNFGPSPIKVRGNYLLWHHSSGGLQGVSNLVLYDLSSNTYSVIGPTSPGPNPEHVDSRYFDFAVVGGVPVVFYWKTFPTSSPTLYQMFKWTPSGGSVQLFTLTNPAQGHAIATDGITVAWTEALNTSATSYSVKSMPVAGGATTILETSASTADGLQLRGGVAAWHVQSAGQRTSKVWSQSQGAVLLSPAGSSVASVNSGYAVYSDATSTRTWQGATGTTSLRIEAPVSRAQITDNWIYWQAGEAIYRIPLN